MLGQDTVEDQSFTVSVDDVKLRNKYEKIIRNQIHPQTKVLENTEVHKDEKNTPEPIISDVIKEAEAKVEDKTLAQKMTEIEYKKKAALEESMNLLQKNNSEDEAASKSLKESTDLARKAFETENSVFKIKP